MKALSWVSLVISVAAVALAIFVFVTKSADEPIPSAGGTVLTDDENTSDAVSMVTLRDVELGLAITYPGTWTKKQEQSINPDLISHSGFTVEGDEGSVSVLNATGFGGGPCSAFDSENITLTVAAGEMSVCYKINTDGTVTWGSANEGPKNIDNDLTLDGAEMSIHVSAKATSVDTADFVLSVLKTLDTIPIEAASTDASDPYKGWTTFRHSTGDYSFMVPPGITPIENPGGTIAIASEENGGWPHIEIGHGDSEFFRPTEGADVVTWINEWHKNNGFPDSREVVKSELLIDGRATAFEHHDRSPQAYGSDTYYAIDGTQLYQLFLMDANDKRDEETYRLIVESFKFL